MKISLYSATGAFLLLALLSGCQTKEELSPREETPVSMETKAITPETFDWETDDYMPAPGTQSILVPWAPGNGGLDVFYGPDILYDFKKVNGWKLVYSTFKSTGAPLTDPYFVLYNVYRGTLRIYMYLNSLGGIAASSYMEDAIYLNGSANSSILSFLGSDMAEPGQNVKAFNSVRPKPLSGGAPLINNQWYMVEYELAYDPNLKNTNYLQLRFQMKTDCYNLSTIKLGGKAKSDISGTVGASSSSPMDLVKAQVPETIKGVAGIVGSSLIDKLKKTPTANDSSNNKLGIKNSYFTDIVNGVTKVTSSFFGGIPSFACSLLSAIIGGSSSSAGTPVSLKADTDIQLEGTLTSNSAVNAVSMYIPGMSFGGTVQGYVPLYNEPLGVLNFIGDNTLYIQSQRSYSEVVVNRGGDDEYYTECEIHRTAVFNPRRHWNYADRLVFNPELLKVANVTILSEDLVAEEGGPIYVNMFEYDDYTSDIPGHNIPQIHDYVFGVRFLIKVQPKDGSPASYIYKTFKLNNCFV